MLGQNCHIAVQTGMAMGFLLVPSTILAGSYGPSGVHDSSVTLFVPQEHVWCQRLETVIPLELEMHMECGDPSTEFVRSAIAGERTTRNRTLGLRSLLSNFRHTPIGHEPNQSDSDDNKRPRVTNVSNAGDPETGPDTNPQDDPKEKDTDKNKQADKNVAEAKEPPSGAVN